jgi:acid phosphatase class B
MKTTLTRLFLLQACLTTAACSAPASDDSEGEDELASVDGATYSLACKRGASSAKIAIVAREAAFDLKATVGSNVVFEAAAQRPSLNVKVEDGSSSSVDEYIDFNDQGLETVPVDGPKAIELGLAPASSAHYSKKVTLKNADTNVELDCRFDNAKLQKFLKLNVVSTVDMDGVAAVAFDIDDTLAFTTPSFVRATATGGTPKPDDVLFWTHANGCDLGCEAETITLADGTTKSLPANKASTAKSKALDLIALHKARGHKVYAITARPDINGDHLRDYVEQELGIAREDVFFEPDLDQPGNVKGKTDRIESLNLDIFYGDSDSDITDAAKAFSDGSGGHRKVVRGVRFQRSPKSSNRKAGKLNKYHPGYFGEPVLKGSYE